MGNQQSIDNKKKPSDEESAAPKEFRSETKEFLYTLQKYLECRESLDRKYEEVDPEKLLIDMIQTFSLIEVRDENDNIKPKEFMTEYQQQSVTGGPVQNVDELYDAAKAAQQSCQDAIKKVVSQISGEGIEVKFADLKGRERAVEKAEDDYSDRNPGPGVSWLYDIVRGSIMFSSAEQILKCWELLQADESIHIVKAKNRFQNPTLTGYRDLNLHIQIDIGDGFKHICEIQIHLKEIKTLSIDIHSHKYYEFFRTFFAGAIGSLKERLDDLERISDGASVDSKFIKDMLDESKNDNEHAERLERLARLFEDQLCEYEVAFQLYERLSVIYKMNKDQRKLADAHYQMGVVLFKGGMDGAMFHLEKSLKLNKNKKGRKGKEDAILSIATLIVHRSVNYCHYNSTTKAVALDNVDGDDVTYTPINAYYDHQDTLVRALKMYQQLKKDHVGLGQRLMLQKEPLKQAITMCNVANVLQEQLEFDKATKLYEEALQVFNEKLGEEHLLVAKVFNCQSILLKEQGKLDEAKAKCELSLGITKKELGESHPSVAKVLNNMGLVYEELGELDKAVSCYREALDACTKSLGEDHVSMVGLCCNMASALEKRGEHEEALEMCDKILAMSKNVKGENDLQLIVFYMAKSKVMGRLDKQDKVTEEERISALENAKQIWVAHKPSRDQSLAYERSAEDERTRMERESEENNLRWQHDREEDQVKWDRDREVGAIESQRRDDEFFKREYTTPSPEEYKANMKEQWRREDEAMRERWRREDEAMRARWRREDEETRERRRMQDIRRKEAWEEWSNSFVRTKLLV